MKTLTKKKKHEWDKKRNWESEKVRLGERQSRPKEKSDNRSSFFIPGFPAYLPRGAADVSLFTRKGEMTTCQLLVSHTEGDGSRREEMPAREGQRSVFLDNHCSAFSRR